jgi:CubicO group peptidase (beta-lactamase class C family)
MFRPTRDNRRPSPARTGVLLAATAGTVLAVAVMPSPPRLDEATTGDAELARTVRELAGGSGWQSLSVAVIDADGVRTAGVGTTGGDDPQPVVETTAYEIGSVGKVLTGMLLADSGLDPDTPVSELLPDVEFNDAGTASATLAELATHRSGLPRLRITPPFLAQSVLHRFIGVDPYAGDDRAAVLADAAAASAGSKGEVRYSNLGVALLGQALAEQAGMPYRDLLIERILEPLGMKDTTVAGTAAELLAPRADPFRANGLAVEPWLASGWGPAGIGPWSTAADLSVLVQAMLVGTAPGADAARPRFVAGENEQIGYGWFTDTVDGRQITWHNGGTGGFRSFVGFDADAGVGVVVLSNTDRSVDPIGRQLLGVDSADGPPVLQIGVTLFLTFGGALMMYLNRHTDRLGLVRDVSTGLVMLLVAYTAGSWEVVPPAVWILGVGTLAAAAVPVALRWPDLPTRATGRAWTRVTGAAVPIALGLALAVRLAMI